MILPFRRIEVLSIQEAVSEITTAPKKRLRDVQLFDFIMHDGQELPDGVNGIYFFFAPNSTTCLYVGKNSSPQFIERIPWHFAISEASWQNHFLKYYKKSHQSASLFEAAKDAEECQILLMPVPLEDGLIARAEDLFRVFQRPKFNALTSGGRFRRLSSVPPDAVLGEVVRNSSYWPSPLVHKS